MNPIMDPKPVLRTARCAYNRAACIASDLRMGQPALVTTEDEFGAAVVYIHETSAITAAAAAAAAVLPGALGAPAWAGNLMNTVHQIITLANHTTSLVNLTTNLANLITARQMNSTTYMDMTDHPLAHFPATVGALHNLNGPTLQALLAHYGWNDVPNQVEARRRRRRRFQQFIGIIRPYIKRVVVTTTNADHHHHHHRQTSCHDPTPASPLLPPLPPARLSRSASRALWHDESTCTTEVS
jgi:hypothetical protein